MQLTDGVKYINPKLLMTNDSYNDPTFTSTHGHNDRVGLPPAACHCHHGHGLLHTFILPFPIPMHGNVVMVSIVNLATVMEWKSYL